MSKFCALFSGSSGNSMVVCSGGGGLLVDAGVSCRAILAALGQQGIDPAALGGILVTHEHIDHVRGLKVLLKKYDLPVYGSAGTLNSLFQSELVPPTAQLRVLAQPTTLCGMEVTPFATPHDAAGPLGFVLQTAEGERLGIATDLGHITPEVEAALSGCATVVLEANYDEPSLQSGPYPYYLKQRIASNFGHLSNRESAEQCLRLVQQGTRQLVLCHLSRENNTPALAAAAVSGPLGRAGWAEGRDYRLQVASRSAPSPVIYF